MLGIPASEFQRRQQALQDHMREQGWEGVVIFDAAYILYYTGFAFIPTERPIAWLMNANGERVLFVPRLEEEHARGQAHVDEVVSYPEYPDRPHPMQRLRDLLDRLGIRTSLAADYDGYPPLFGYEGPRLSDLLAAPVVSPRGFIEAQMQIKSPVEIAHIRESARWAHLAHTLLQRYTRVGASETEVSQRASMEATQAMLDTLGPLYRALSPWGFGATAGYRGQIGRKAALPHALAGHITFRPGDVVVTGATAPVWGYHAELERTMILAPVREEHRRFFEHMVALQDLALSLMRPGVRCSEVDRAVRAYYEEHGLRAYWRHHTGHAIGLRYHEGPFLDVGDDTVLRPGMVFTVEPGLYVPDLGGFRHSDTVLITEDGIEILTYYPRHLDALTIEG